MAQPYDDFNYAPPGHSLTEDNGKWPWGRPPQMTNPDDALDDAVKRLMKPRNKQEMFKLLLVGVSVEVIVEGILFQSFQDGKFTPDVALLLKGPLAIIISDLAEEEGVPYRMFENDNVLEENEMDDRTFAAMMKENNPQMFQFMRENLARAIRSGSAPREENFMSMKKAEGEE